MLAVTTLFLLYLIQCITANTTTAAQRAQQEAVAACQNLTSSTTGDGTTTTTLLFPNPSCWETLGMTDWMSNWNTTTTICTATQSVLTPCQCRIDEPWATCFMRLTYEKNRTASYVCTNLTKPEDCTAPVPGIVVQGPVEIFVSYLFRTFPASVVQHVKPQDLSREQTLARPVSRLISNPNRDVLTPKPLSMGLIVSGVSQLPSGSRSTSRTGPLTPGLLLALFNYLTTWYTSLTSFTALPAITHELSKTKTSALSANNLLIALVQDYAIDASLSQALVSIITKGPLFRNNDASAKPTLSNAQRLLGQLLQQALEVVTSDWACGDFQAMANGGMLLNGTLETTEILDARLGQQEKK